MYSPHTMWDIVTTRSVYFQQMPCVTQVLFKMLGTYTQIRTMMLTFSLGKMNKQIIKIIRVV